jgi:hypothetical protein
MKLRIDNLSTWNCRLTNSRSTNNSYNFKEVIKEKAEFINLITIFAR